ncbi:MocR-like pyridoxine biosynthesis transcription factor PdxR [Caballeronia insecticola]|uniref:Transcriptional regulator MocR family n=1 Tax=Caballeronia insecticola TaxID=758793 RepID=R4WT39_9BURK|nr:PLP-dependent aminotransferase family protein [Caballeronia insecticola]BAN27753.1 transcriptional regulator MocR family [Caballeronia insecticola]
MDQLSESPHGSGTGTARRIYDMLRGQMADGTLPTGARLPSTRALAADLAVSRTTVTAVYEQLAAEGFVVTAAGRAARVAARPAAPESSNARPVSAARVPSLSAFGRRVAEIAAPTLPVAANGRIDFLYGAVAARDFPALIWRRAYQAELLRQHDSLYYVAPEGDASLRRALQAYLRRARGLVCDAERILVVSGTQQAIDLCARLLLDPGDAFAFEDPGYLIARHSFEAAGARLVPLAVDEYGLDTRSLPADRSARSVRLVYATPSHQFPLGGVLPIGRRLELLAWAQCHDAWVVEDDYDGEFRYGQRPIDALQSIDANGRVIYIGTFSKALSPHLRLGYMALPAALVPVFRQAKRLSDRHAPVLEQRVLASLIDSGAYERHVRRVRREYERRRAALLDAIAQWLPERARVAGTAAGLHVVLWLPQLSSRDEAAIVAAAHEKGVGVYPVAPLFAAKRPRPAGLILGYASLTVDEIRRGIGVLAAVIDAFER